jgi:hypothetical protein
MIAEVDDKCAGIIGNKTGSILDDVNIDPKG